MNKFLIALSVLTLFAIPTGAFVSSASTNYGSILQLSIHWTDCYSSSDYGSIVIQIPPPPATWTRISWNMPVHSGEGIGAFKLCVNVPFTQINGQMFDANGLWYATLNPSLTPSSGSVVEPIIGHAIGYGDTVAFSFQIIYGIAHESLSGSCSAIGTLYGPCTQHY